MANVGMPLQFSRMYRGPLDEKDVFESYELAVAYANSPIGYPGHIIAVKTTEFRRDVYVINDDKSLSHISVTRNDIDITLSADNWSSTKPYSYRVEVSDLYEDDNVVVSMGSNSTRDQYDAVINARISNIEQGDGYVIFYCDEDKPTVDIDLRLVVGGLINAVELPNSATVDTKYKTIRVHASNWDTDNSTYRLIVEDLLSRDNAVVSVASNLTSEQINAIIDADIDIIEQGNGYVILKSNGTVPYLDFDITVAFGDNIVVVPNDTVIKSESYSRNLTLLANRWEINTGISTTKCVQSFELEGMTETVNGSVIVPSTLSNEEIEALAAAEIFIVQGDGIITFVCNGSVPMFDITIGITYGHHINIIQGASTFIDRTALAQYTAFTLIPEYWVYNSDIELYLYTLSDIPDLNESINGYIGLGDNITKEAEAQALLCEISMYDITDNTILLTAIEAPTVEIPINLIFGGNIVVARTNKLITEDIAEAENILYSNDNVPLHNVAAGLDYAINQNPTSLDPSRTIMASTGNVPNGIIMKDAFNNKNYLMRLENGVMNTRELDSRLLPFFNGIKGVFYPLTLYRQLNRMESDTIYHCWGSLLNVVNIIKSNGKLVFSNIGNATNGRLAIGTIPELLTDLPDICNYTVYDVKSNCYLHAYNGSLYYTGGVYDYPEDTNFKVHGTIADRPTSASKKGTIYFNETNGEYYIWDGTSWNTMPTML